MSRAEAIRSMKHDDAIAEVLLPVVSARAFTSMRDFAVAVIDALADHAELVDGESLS